MERTITKLILMLFLCPVLLSAQPADFTYPSFCAGDNALAFTAIRLDGANTPPGCFMAAYTDIDLTLTGVGPVIDYGATLGIGTGIGMDISVDNNPLPICAGLDAGISYCNTTCERFKFLLYVPDLGSGACYYQVPTPWIDFVTQSSFFGDEVVGYGSLDGSILNVNTATAVCYPTAAAAIAAAALPVELRSFTAKPNGDQAELEWITDSETSNSHFEVEHSLDGRTFTKIGRVDGAGTTLEAQTYQFTHALPTKGVNHYRLKQVDFDQSFDYSSVVTVNFDQSAEPSLRLYPNPATDRVTINLAGEWQEDAIETLVIDLNGKVVAQLYNVGLGTVNTELPELAAGVYLLTISDGHQVVKERLVIQ